MVDGSSISQMFTSVARLGVILSLGSMLITGFLHGDMMAFAGAGLQYWFMQPIFWNILQVGAQRLGREERRCGRLQEGGGGGAQAAP
jgi:fucose permease